jgi:hypothetical protein
MASHRRMNIRVSEETHYWINLDAARHGRSLQEHVDALLSERARAIAGQFENVRPPQPDEGRKGGAYPAGGLPASLTCDRQS